MRKKAAIIFWLAFAAAGICQSDKTAPDFKLQDIDKNTVQLSSQTGRGPLLISFWATWCKPCVEEMQELVKIHNEFHDKGFDILAVSIDNEKTVARVKSFAKAKKYPFTVLLDTNGETAQKYYVGQSVPAAFLLDKDGRIIYQSSGYKKGDELKLRKKIEDLLR